MNKPYTIINCAMSADGKIALPNRKQMRISSKEDIERMYKLRSECDAILVGIETILSDDPKLTVKERYVKNPKQPLRVVLDSKGRTPKNALAVDNSANTLIFTIKGNEKQYYGKHIEVVGCKADNEGHIDIVEALNLLYEKGIKKLLIEGGGTVIWSFLKKRLVDDLYVYIGPYVIGGKNTPTMADGEGIRNIEEVLSLRIVDVTRLSSGILVHYKMIK